MKTKTRRVFGRRRITAYGKEYIVELRSAGLVVREKYKRLHHELSPFQIVDAAIGQLHLPLRMIESELTQTPISAKEDKHEESIHPAVVHCAAVAGGDK